MRRQYNFWKSRCVCVLIVVIFVLFSNISGIYSQNIDLPKGPLLHNGKEPPDIRIMDTSEQTLPSVRERNSGRAKQRFIKKPMTFLCSSRTPMFVSRRNVSPQTSESPFVITVTQEITKDKLIHGMFLINIKEKCPDFISDNNNEQKFNRYINKMLFAFF